MRRRRRSRTRGSETVSRRRVLLGLGGVGLVGLGASGWTGAFSSVTAARNATVDVASDQNAYLGLNVYSPVKKNSWDPLVDVTNNLGETATITAWLGTPSEQTCSDGTLRDAAGDTGCPVSFTLSPGATKLVELNADVKDTTIPFTVEATTASATVTATRETYAESGNTASAVTVKKVHKFSADANRDEWGVQQVKVRADQHGFGRVEYEIRDGDGTTVAGDTVYPSGIRYDANNVTITPDEGYSVRSGESYTLQVTGYDSQGNHDTATRSATA